MAVDTAINSGITRAISAVPLAAPVVVAAQAATLVLGHINELSLSRFEKEHALRDERQQNPLTYSQIRDLRHGLDR